MSESNRLQTCAMIIMYKRKLKVNKWAAYTDCEIIKYLGQIDYKYLRVLAAIEITMKVLTS